MTGPQQAVLNAIHWGRANALKADAIHAQVADLVKREWRTQVHVREVIRELVLLGEPIVSSPSHGSWKTDEIAELRACERSLRSRARSISERADAFSDMVRARSGQPTEQGELFE